VPPRPVQRRGRLPDRSRDPLIALSRAFAHGETLRDANAAGDGPDWDRMVTRAEHERLAPLLHVAVRDGAVPGPVRGRLRSAWTAAERQHLLAGAALREIVGAFGRARIETILLKGPALAAEYYADPALRPYTDLDVLVRRRDREAAMKILAQLGYVHGSPGRSLAYELEHAPAAYFVSTDGARLPVDLHWDCVAHPGGGRATDLVADELWSRAVAAPAWGDAARVLAVEDLLVYLAAHLAIHHALAGTLWQLDVALVLARHGAALDWGAVTDRARRWGAAGAVYFALRAVDVELSVAAPRAAMDRLRPGAVRVALVDRLLRAGPERLIALEYVVGLTMLDRVSDMLRMLASGIAPLPRWLRARYESPSIAAAYAAHYGRLIAAAGRAIHRVSVR
jgi:hypothetical protein